MSKPTILYGETYKKGTIIDDHSQLLDKINREGTVIFAKSHNEMSDNTQELTITVKFKNK